MTTEINIGKIVVKAVTGKASLENEQDAWLGRDTHVPLSIVNEFLNLLRSEEKKIYFIFKDDLKKEMSNIPSDANVVGIICYTKSNQPYLLSFKKQPDDDPIIYDITLFDSGNQLPVFQEEEQLFIQKILIRLKDSDPSILHDSLNNVSLLHTEESHVNVFLMVNAFCSAFMPSGYKYVMPDSYQYSARFVILECIRNKSLNQMFSFCFSIIKEKSKLTQQFETESNQVAVYGLKIDDPLFSQILSRLDKRLHFVNAEKGTQYEIGIYAYTVDAPLNYENIIHCIETCTRIIPCCMTIGNRHLTPRMIFLNPIFTDHFEFDFKPLTRMYNAPEELNKIQLADLVKHLTPWVNQFPSEVIFNTRTFDETLFPKRDHFNSSIFVIESNSPSELSNVNKDKFGPCIQTSRTLDVYIMSTHKYDLENVSIYFPGARAIHMFLKDKGDTYTLIV